MAYSANIPLSTDLLSTSQGDIQANFQALNTFLTVNHEGFSSADAGKHKFVTFPLQAGNPAIAAGEIALFNKNSTLTTFNELFIKNQAGTVYPITADLAAATGWCYTPSGLLEKWGVVSGTGNATITFPVAPTIPVFATPLAGQLTVQGAATDNDRAVALIAMSNVDFDVFVSPRTTTGSATATFTYRIIGIPV